MSLKEKTLNGLFWSFIDNFANLGVQFLIGIVLARVLDPREFGVNGMLAIFIAVSQVFVDSGFSSALIRKTDCTSKDYSTVFYFNLVISILIYILLFLFSENIAVFFKEPQLKSLVRVLGISLIINAVSIVQRTILTKEINFKLQTKISLISALGSGIIAIFLAWKGYGVWSLIALKLVGYIINTCLLWFWQVWTPEFIFSRSSFQELFGFGSKLLASSLISTIYKNIYSLVIGKYFNAEELGYYSSANQFQSLPSSNLTSVIGRVTYPTLANMQSDKQMLKVNYQKIIRSTMFITFILMVGMAAVAKPLIISLVGAKWIPAVIYLQMLCFVGMFYPLHALNLNMLNVQGRSDLFLRLEIIKTVLAVPTLIIGIFYGIKIMILGIFLNNLIAYYINSYWSGKMIGYSCKQQLGDIFPSFIIAIIIGSVLFGLNFVIFLPAYITLLIQVVVGFLLTILLGELLRIQDYIVLRDLVVERYQSNKWL